MHKTLKHLYSHLAKLHLQLRWAMYAYHFSTNTSPDLVAYQKMKIADIQDAIAGTNAAIYYAEMNAVDLSDLVGYRVAQQGSQAVINFDQPVKH